MTPWLEQQGDRPGWCCILRLCPGRACWLERMAPLLRHLLDRHLRYIKRKVHKCDWKYCYTGNALSITTHV
jgi:hypothetical protein